MKTIKLVTFVPAGIGGEMTTIEAKDGDKRGMRVHGMKENYIREAQTRVWSVVQPYSERVMDLHLHVTGRGGPGNLDLPLAIAALVWCDVLTDASVEGVVFIGELSLSGRLCGTRGVVGALRAAVAAGYHRAIVPAQVAASVAPIAGIDVLVAQSFAEVVEHFRAGATLTKAGEWRSHHDPAAPRPTMPLSRAALRAVEIAAAGGHHLLLLGPWNAGDEPAARRLAEILPALSAEDKIEVLSMLSVHGIVSHEGWTGERAFRSPHHTASAAALVGGGDPIRPGELSVANHGVLFLDRIEEFMLNALDSVRYAVDRGFVDIRRTGERVVFPARAHLVASAEFGPTTHNLFARLGRIPLVARFQMHATLPATDHDARVVEPIEASRARVAAARALQADRNPVSAGRVLLNAELDLADLCRVANLDDADWAAFNAALNLPPAASQRASDLERKALYAVARTIADLDGERFVTAAHVAEAATYRQIATEEVAIPLSA